MIVLFKTEKQLTQEFGNKWRIISKGFSFVEPMSHLLGTIREVYYEENDWVCEPEDGGTWYVDIRWVIPLNYLDFFEDL